jgi:hypothetical protein
MRHQIRCEAQLVKDSFHGGLVTLILNSIAAQQLIAAD